MKYKGELVTTSLRLPKELKRALEKEAQAYGYRFTDFVRLGLDKWAMKHEAGK